MPGEAIDAGFTEHFLTSFDGTRLYYRRYGGRARTNPSVLCLAGMSRNCRDYHQLATVLSHRHLVICPDYRGVGRSQYGSNRHAYSPQAWIGDIRALLAALNLHNVVIVGTSFGGLLAAAIAVAAPSVLAGAVLNDIGPEIGGGALDLVTAHIGKYRRYSDLDQAISYMKKSFPDMPAQSDDEWRTLTENTFRAVDGALVTNWDPAIGKALAELRRQEQDLWPLFCALARVPILAFRGEQSKMLSAETFEHMQSGLSGIASVSVPEVGHAPNLAKPELVQEIEKFLGNLGKPEPATGAV